MAANSERFILLLSVFIIATCGLVYELLTGAVASYIMGNSVTQYSLVIGFFLAAMGVGAYLTKYVKTNLREAFVKLQILVGIVGGLSSLCLFVAFRLDADVQVFVLGFSVVIGAMVGAEIPLVVRLIESGSSVRLALSEVLGIDYIGALAASLLFPFILLPYLGLVRSAMAFGILNVAVAFLGIWILRPHGAKRLVGFGVFAMTLLTVGFIGSSKATTWVEDGLYQDEIIFSEQTAYQKVVVTRWNQDFRLYLNGHLQFSTADEYRYHESLVLPALSSLKNVPNLRVLVLGGGDGLVIRQILRFQNVGAIELVDLDERVVRLFRDNALLKNINDASLSHEKVKLTFADAFQFLRSRRGQPYDLIIMDLPDPSSTATNKLYTRTFFQMAKNQLSQNGILVTQATSPFYAREAFWCIRNTMQSVAGGAKIYPYHTYIPSFGDWGFVMMAPSHLRPQGVSLPKDSRYLTQEILPQLFVFPGDSGPIETAINSLEHPYLLSYHEDGWKQFHE